MNWRQKLAKSENFKDDFKPYKEKKREIINRAEFTGDKFPKSGDPAKVELNHWKAGDSLGKKDRKTESTSSGSAVLNPKVKRENFKKTSNWRDKLIKKAEVDFRQKPDGEVSISVTTPQQGIGGLPNTDITPSLESPLEEEQEEEENIKEGKYLTYEELDEWAKNNPEAMEEVNRQNEILEGGLIPIDEAKVGEGRLFTERELRSKAWQNPTRISIDDARGKPINVGDEVSTRDDGFGGYLVHEIRPPKIRIHAGESVQWVDANKVYLVKKYEDRKKLNWQFPSIHQNLMDEAYDLYQKPENENWSEQEFLDNLPSQAHKDAVVLGNLNYQVENGGFLQWWDNGYGERDYNYLVTTLLPSIGTETANVVKDLVKQSKKNLESIKNTEQDLQWGHYSTDEEADAAQEEIDNLYADNSLDYKYYEINKTFLDDVANYLANIKTSSKRNWRQKLGVSEPDVNFKRKPDGTFELNVTHPKPEVPEALPILDTQPDVPPQNVPLTTSSKDYPKAKKGEEVYAEYDKETKEWHVFGLESGHSYWYGDEETAKKKAKEMNENKKEASKKCAKKEWIIKFAKKGKDTYNLIGRECDTHAGIFIERIPRGIFSKKASKQSKIIDFEKIEKNGATWPELINSGLWQTKFDEFINGK
ncbi:MAG: DMP19 family protein [Novosphingobium sp.]|nr:DMP19 family protein [Novosphingobium sp.]